MELNTFKQLLDSGFLSNGFAKKARFYYHYVEDFIFVIGLQKSNYSNSYYINIGLVIRQLNPELQYPRDIDGDIRARFDFEVDDKCSDLFDLQQINELDKRKLSQCIQDNIDTLVKSVTSLDTLKTLLKNKPVLLYQTTIRAKEFLGLI